MEHLPNGTIREYLGVEFILSVKKALEDVGVNDINKGWVMLGGYEFIKFDLEYVYYQKK